MADTLNPSTSGSFNHTAERNTMMLDSLVNTGVVDVTYVFDSDTRDFCVRKLNNMLKSWQNDGLQLWRLRRMTLFLEKDLHLYQVGPRRTPPSMASRAGRDKQNRRR